MKTVAKLAIGAAAIGAAIWAYRKFVTTKESVFMLENTIAKINNVKLSLSAITLNMDLRLTNKSMNDIGINTFSLLSIKQITFFNRLNNSMIAIADVDINGLQIKSGESTIIKDIVTTFPTIGLLQNYSLFTNSNFNLMENLRVVLEVETMGKRYTVDSESFV